jgi:SMC interacting uncharacterized protein involved in chromosome segregation
VEVEQLQQSAAASKSSLEKIVTENERLVKDYKRELAKSEKLQLALSTLQIQHDKLTQEVDRLGKSAPRSVPKGLASSGGQRKCDEGLEVRVEQLQAEVEKKTVMLMEVKRHLKEAAERERELKNISSESQVG